MNSEPFPRITVDKNPKIASWTLPRISISQTWRCQLKKKKKITGSKRSEWNGDCDDPIHPLHNSYNWDCHYNIMALNSYGIITYYNIL